MHYPWNGFVGFSIQPFHPTPNLCSFFYHLRSLRLPSLNEQIIISCGISTSQVQLKCWARKKKQAPGWCKLGCVFSWKNHPMFPYISLEFHWFSEWWSSWQNDPSSCWRFYWNIEDLHPNILKFQPILTTHLETFWLHKNGDLLLWTNT